MRKVSAFGRDAGSQALTPFVDCVINDGLLQALPHVNQPLLQVGYYVTGLRLVNSLLYCCTPELVIDWIHIWAIKRPQISTDLAKHNVRINSKVKQVAQLSQRDRTMVRVIEYFAKSLKITQVHSK